MGKQWAHAVVAFCVAALLAIPAPAVARDDFTVRSQFPLTISGPQASAETALTLPEGTQALRMTGRVNSTYSLPGAIVVTVNDRQVATVPARTGGRIRVPLQELPTPGGTLRVGLALRLQPKDVCADVGAESASLQRLRVTYRQRGASTPRSVAAFMQGAPREVTVTTDTLPSSSEQQAVLNAVTVAASAFGPGTQVRYVPDISASQSAAVDRVIRISEGGPAEVSVAGRVLTVEGPPSSLTQSVLALASPYLPVAGAPVAASPSASAVDRFGDLSQSLRELNLAVPALTGVGVSTLNLPIDQTAFGRPISGVKVNLQGVVTPVIEGTGWVNILWNSQMLASTPLTESSAYNASVTVGADKILRGNTLTVQLQYQPKEGCRAGVLPARLDLDPDSVVTASAGQTLAGFAMMPQSLSQVTPVAFGNPDRPVPSLQNAAAILAGLQKLTPRLIEVQLLGWDAFVADARPGLAVGVSPEQDAALDAPLRLSPFRTVDGQNEELTAAVDGDFAALQAYNTGRRSLILLGATAGADEQAAALSRRASDVRGGWASMSGTIAVAQPGQPIAFLSEASLAVQPEKVAERGVLGGWWLLLGVAGVVIVLVAAAGIRWARRRSVG